MSNFSQIHSKFITQFHFFYRFLLTRSTSYLVRSTLPFHVSVVMVHLISKGYFKTDCQRPSVENMRVRSDSNDITLELKETGSHCWLALSDFLICWGHMDDYVSCSPTVETWSIDCLIYSSVINCVLPSTLAG